MYNRVILGNTYRIYKLCSEEGDISTNINLFYKRLRARGYSSTQLIPLFKKAAYLAEQRKTSQVPSLIFGNNASTDRIFLHLQFDPGDPPSYKFQKLWKAKILAPPFYKSFTYNKNQDGNNFDTEIMTLSYKRPQTLVIF